MIEHENFYLELCRWDVIDKFKNLFANGMLSLRDDCKITHKRTMAYDTPWIFTRCSDRDCYLYHSVLYSELKMIHSRCHQCWKVVAEPNTLEELFDVYKIQKEINRSSKCGIEGNRKNSNKRFGAYWYNDSLEDGQHCYEIVRKALPKNISVILKRACTEFEQEQGDSKDWVITEEQVHLEHVLSEIWDGDPTVIQQHHHLRCHIMRMWIQEAFKWGDPTVHKFTGGEPLFRPLRTYHITPEEKEKENG